jgi:phage/plasmid-like protein (TIGR03299 family)
MIQNLETMLNSRMTTWDTLGKPIKNAKSSQDVLRQAGLDFKVVQQPVFTGGRIIEGKKANVREDNNAVLGIVSNKYQVCQNDEVYGFIDNLFQEGVKFESGGTLNGGKRCWLLAKLPSRYTINSEQVDPYVCFCTSHDGSLSLSVFMTPIRIVCSNAINLALTNASRSWSSKHIGDIQHKLPEAHQTLDLASGYMNSLMQEIANLRKIKLTDTQVINLIQNQLAPYPNDPSAIQKKNVDQTREDMLTRYFEFPDLKVLPKNGYRFISAMSDHATHATPLRQTANYDENLFMKTLEGNPLIDRSYEIIKAIA